MHPQKRFGVRVSVSEFSVEGLGALVEGPFFIKASLNETFSRFGLYNSTHGDPHN